MRNSRQQHPTETIALSVAGRYSDMSSQSPQPPRLSSADAAKRLLAALADSSWDSDVEPDLPRIEGYVLIRRLGEGGGGTVFQAVRSGSDRLLAIKVIRTGDRSEVATQRAWRELAVLSEVRSPYVPRVHDYGVSEGRLYIVTEFVDGLPLKKHCDTHGLGPRDRVDMIARLAEIVQTELHQHGVIHRDLKPENVLIDGYGQPVIIDLGIAQILNADASTTITNVPVGTPAFMAPEQARSERRGISTRTDIYALGVTALHLLIGQGPHPSDLALHELIRRTAELPGAHPSSLGVQPRSLADVLGKAIAFNPSERYASMAEFAQDLRRWLNHEPVSASPPSILQRIDRFRRKHRATFYTGLAAVFGLVAVGSVLWGLAQWRAQQRTNALLDTITDLRNQAQRQADELSAQSLKYESQFEKWRAEMADGVAFAESLMMDENNYKAAAEMLSAMSALRQRGVTTNDPEFVERMNFRRQQILHEVIWLLYGGPADLRAVDEEIRKLEQLEHTSSILDDLENLVHGHNDH